MGAQRQSELHAVRMRAAHFENSFFFSTLGFKLGFGGPQVPADEWCKTLGDSLVPALLSKHVRRFGLGVGDQSDEAELDEDLDGSVVAHVSRMPQESVAVAVPDCAHVIDRVPVIFDEFVDDVTEEIVAAAVGDRKQFEQRCGAQLAQVAVRKLAVFERARARSRLSARLAMVVAVAMAVGGRENDAHAGRLEIASVDAGSAWRHCFLGR